MLCVVVCCSLFVVCCLLFVGCCLLCAMRCVACAVRCGLVVVCSVFCAVRSALLLFVGSGVCLPCLVCRVLFVARWLLFVVC